MGRREPLSEGYRTNVLPKHDTSSMFRRRKPKSGPINVDIFFVDGVFIIGVFNARLQG